MYICVGITFFFCYLKATKGLESRLQDLEVMRVQLAVTQVEVEGWVTDVKEWAEGESYTITDQCVSSAEKKENLYDFPVAFCVTLRLGSLQLAP